MSSTQTPYAHCCPLCGSASTHLTGTICTFDADGLTPDAGPRGVSETESYICEECWYRWDGEEEFKRGETKNRAPSLRRPAG
jgi:hypothetical protein